MVVPLIVFDTDVIVRALIGSEEGDSYRVIEAAGTGALRVALSDDGLRELRRIVIRQEDKLAGPARTFDVTNSLWAHATLHHPQRYDWPSVSDSDDYWQPDLAYEATADFIVTWDPHLLDAELPLPTEVLDATELLSRLPI